MTKDANIVSCKQAGMSLVEVLVAIVLFSLGSLMAVTMTTSSMRANSHSHAIGKGTNLGRVNMEWLLSLDYNSTQLLDTNVDGLAGLLDTGTAADFSAVNGNYQVAWNIANNEPVNGAKTLSVIVSWQGSSGDKRVVFQTIKAE